jgi:hypothetical protein
VRAGDLGGRLTCAASRAFHLLCSPHARARTPPSPPRSISDSNGWFYYSFNFDDFRTLFGAFTELSDPEGLDPEWVISPAGAAALEEDASAASLAPLSHSGTRLSLNGSDLQVLQVSDELPHLHKALLLARDGSARLLRNKGWALMGPWTSHEQVESMEGEEQQQELPPLDLVFGGDDAWVVEGGEEGGAAAAASLAAAAAAPTPPPAAPRPPTHQRRPHQRQQQQRPGGGQAPHKPESPAARRQAAMERAKQLQKERQRAFKERQQQQQQQQQQQRGN